MNKMHNTHEINTNDYFSDDENDEEMGNDSGDEEMDNVDAEDQEDDDEDDDMDEVDVMDDETRRIVYQSLCKKMNQSESTNINKKDHVYENPTKLNKSIKSIKPIKPKTVFSLKEFIQKVEIDEKYKQSKQPKKFVSKRAHVKKQELGVREKPTYKRTFNPRLPPYNFVHGNKEIVQQVNLSNEQDFPSLNRKS